MNFSCRKRHAWRIFRSTATKYSKNCRVIFFQTFDFHRSFNFPTFQLNLVKRASWYSIMQPLLTFSSQWRFISLFYKDSKGSFGGCYESQAGLLCRDRWTLHAGDTKLVGVICHIVALSIGCLGTVSTFPHRVAKAVNVTQRLVHSYL